jgi:hypothetical protein
VAPPPERAARIRALLAPGLDWHEVLQCARRNRILALLHDGLRGPLAALPPEPRAALERHERRARFRNLQHLHEMLALVRALRAGGVEALPYKGPVLGSLLYPDIALREYRDLDLIVRPSDLESARRLVVERGYEPLDRLSAAGEEKHLSADCEFHFRHPESGILLEIHWEVLPRTHRFGFAVEEAWERLVPATVSGTPCRVFAAEDLLLVLCIHGGEKHRWMRLQMLSDVARLLAREPALDWDAVLGRAAETGRAHTVELGALLAWALLDAPLPEDVLRRALASRAVRVQAALTRGRTFSPVGGLPDHAEWRHYSAELAERARRRGLSVPADGFLSYLGGVLTPEWNDRQALPLPRPLAWVHYAYRPLRLLRLHRGGLLKRLGPRFSTE